MTALPRRFMPVVAICFFLNAASGAAPVEAPIPWPRLLAARVVDTRGNPVRGARVGVGVQFSHTCCAGLASIYVIPGGFGFKEDKGRRHRIRAHATDKNGDVDLPTAALDSGERVVLLAVSPAMRRDGAEAVSLIGSTAMSAREAWQASAADGLLIQVATPLIVRGQVETRGINGPQAAPPARAGVIAVDIDLDVVMRRTDGLTIRTSILSPTVAVAPDAMPGLHDFEIPVPPGEYRMTVKYPGARTATRDIIVPLGEDQNRLDPIRLRKPRHSTLFGRPAPVLRGIDGWANSPRLTLSDLRGKVVLINFWGLWCSPCVAEMPALAGLDGRFRDRGLIVLGVHCDADGEADIESFNRRVQSISDRRWSGRRPSFPIALTYMPDASPPGTPDSPALDYEVTAFPTSFLIGRDGKIIGLVDPTEMESTAEMIELALEAPLVAPKP